MDAILAPEAIAAPEQAAKDLVAEANHRIANSLTLLVSMVRMQASAASKRADALTAAEVRLMLEGVAARISTIAFRHFGTLTRRSNTANPLLSISLKSAR